MKPIIVMAQHRWTSGKAGVWGAMAVLAAALSLPADQPPSQPAAEKKAGTLKKQSEHSMFEGPHRLKPQREVFAEDARAHWLTVLETLSEENLSNPSRKYKMALAKERYKHLPPQKIIEALQVKEGMTIVDVGASAGFFTIPLARALHGSGMVYATDIDPPMIDLLRKRAETEKLKNVVPVLVRGGDCDPFYRDKSFDLIFMSSLYEYLLDPVPYMRELGQSLKNTGRMVLIHPKVLWQFEPEDFYNFPAIFDNLHAKGDSHPLFQRMAPELKTYILSRQHQSSAGIPPKYADLFAQALNKTSDDPRFFGELTADAEQRRALGSYAVSSRLQQFTLTARWIYYAHHELFHPPYQVVTEEDRVAVRMMNKCLLVPLFVGHPFFEGYIFPRGVIVSDREIVRKMGQAGFSLLRRHDFLNYFHLLEFVRAPG